MTTTTNRGYNTPATGAEVGSWGTSLNGNMTLIDNNLGGVTSVSLTNVNVTLNSTQYQCGTVRLSGTLSGNVLVLFPNVSGWWVIDNQTVPGAFYVAARAAAGGNQIGLPPGETIDVYCDATNMGYRNLGRVGTYWDYAGSAVPAWVTGSTVPPFLLCDGSSFSSGTYPQLNAILGGTTLPDTRGRMRANLNDGTARITTAGSGIDGNTRLSAGGTQSAVLSIAEMPVITPAGTIGITDPGHTHTDGVAGTAVYRADVTSPGTFNVASSPSGATGSSATGISASFTGTSFGSGTAHNNMTPTYIGGITMIRAG